MPQWPAGPVVPGPQCVVRGRGGARLRSMLETGLGPRAQDPASSPRSARGSGQDPRPAHGGRRTPRACAAAASSKDTATPGCPRGPRWRSPREVGRCTMPAGAWRRSAGGTRMSPARGPAWAFSNNVLRTLPKKGLSQVCGTLPVLLEGSGAPGAAPTPRARPGLRVLTASPVRL